jgi:hypothetical protein
MVLSHDLQEKIAGKTFMDADDLFKTLRRERIAIPDSVIKEIGRDRGRNPAKLLAGVAIVMSSGSWSMMTLLVMAMTRARAGDPVNGNDTESRQDAGGESRERT